MSMLYLVKRREKHKRKRRYLAIVSIILNKQRRHRVCCVGVTLRRFKRVTQVSRNEADYEMFVYIDTMYKLRGSILENCFMLF